MNPPKRLPTCSPSSLLASVVQITGQRDKESLELSLVKTLDELIGTFHIILYKLQAYDGRNRVLPLVRVGSKELEPGQVAQEEDGESGSPIEDKPDFVACLEQRNVIKTQCKCGAGNHIRFVYPVLGGKDTMAGFLEICSKKHSALHENLITGFLKIYQNYLTILDDSQRDSLTGLLNRKTFDSNIIKIASTDRSSAHGAGVRPVLSRWLAVIDVDFFKSVNDRFGHVYGDEVLLLLACLMEQSFRLDDKLFRFGGEEFVVVLEPTSYENAWKTLERFRLAVSNFSFPDVGAVTVSIGFSRIHSDDRPSIMVSHADKALYYAKHHGRNQVCSYEKLIEEGALVEEDFNSQVGT